MIQGLEKASRGESRDVDAAVLEPGANPNEDGGTMAEVETTATHLSARFAQKRGHAG